MHLWSRWGLQPCPISAVLAVMPQHCTAAACSHSPQGGQWGPTCSDPTAPPHSGAPLMPHGSAWWHCAELCACAPQHRAVWGSPRCQEHGLHCAALRQCSPSAQLPVLCSTRCAAMTGAPELCCRAGGAQGKLCPTAAFFLLSPREQQNFWMRTTRRWDLKWKASACSRRCAGESAPRVNFCTTIAKSGTKIAASTFFPPQK